MELRVITLKRDYSDLQIKSLKYEEDDVDWDFYTLREHAKVMLCRPIQKRGEIKEICLVNFSTENGEPFIQNLGINIDFSHSIVVLDRQFILINHEKNCAENYLLQANGTSTKTLEVDFETEGIHLFNQKPKYICRI